MILFYNRSIITVILGLSSFFMGYAGRGDSLKPQPSNTYYNNLKDYCKKVDRLEKELIKRDSLLKIAEVNLIKVDYVEKNVGTRFDDLYKLLGTIISLLIALGVGSYYKSKSSAREIAEETAKKQFEEKFSTYHEKIIKMENEAETLLEQIREHEKTATKLNDKDPESMIKSLLEFIKSQKKGGQE